MRVVLPYVIGVIGFTVSAWSSGTDIKEAAITSLIWPYYSALALYRIGRVACERIQSCGMRQKGDA